VPPLDQKAADEAVSDASLLLDWKFGFEDGHLGPWTVGDISEFLFGWCPRKLSASQEECVAIPGSIASFTDYLAAEGLLAPGSSAAPVLRAAASDAAPGFVAEMGNPANFGMAKAMFAGAAEFGYDVTREADLSAWVERFNSLSDEEREAIMSDDVLGAGGRGSVLLRRAGSCRVRGAPCWLGRCEARGCSGAGRRATPGRCNR
jgi:hypothetical protein